MTPLLYAKLGAALLVVVLLFGAGYRVGGLRSAAQLSAYKAAVEAQHVAQLEAVVKTMDEHDQQAAAQHAADRRVIDAYDLQKSLPPATAGLVERMRFVEAAACGAGDRVVPSTGPVASGVHAAGGIPRGDPEGDRLLQAALDAADHDATRLNAMRLLAPK